VITLFSEGEETFSIPRGYYNLFLRRRGVEASFRYSEGDNFVVPAEPIDLRPAQKPVVQKVVEYLGSLPFSGAILNINTGGGKTVCGLEIARRMNRKTLVVCPTSVLLDMWIKEAKKFFPQWRVGVLRADKIDIKDKDIVVGTIQSASMKDYETSVYEAFGMLIADECHLVSAQEFSACLRKFNPQYIVGLTGTLKRADGLESVFQYSSGPIFSAEEVKVLDPDIYFVNTKFSHVFRAHIPIDRQVNGFLDKAIENPARNQMIINQAIRAVKANRNVLILTKRVDHAKLLYSHLSNKLRGSDFSAGLAIGETKSADRERAFKASVLVATVQLLSTGFNEPRLDTLILATPIGGNTLHQAIGRVRRVVEEKKKPIVLDLVDTNYQGAVISAKARFDKYLLEGWHLYGYQFFEQEFLWKRQSKISQMESKKQLR